MSLREDNEGTSRGKIKDHRRLEEVTIVENGKYFAGRQSHKAEEGEAIQIALSSYH